MHQQHNLAVKPVNESLYHRRVAHLVITIAQRALGLGSLAKIFDADDPNLICHIGKNMYKLYRSTNTSFYLHRHDGDNFCQPPKPHAGPLVFSPTHMVRSLVVSEFCGLASS